MAPKGPVEFLSRRDRSRRFGFDCPSLIYFKDWTPGGEYSVRPFCYLSPTFKTSFIGFGRCAARANDTVSS